ncbi:MAG TPA: DUF917 family protein [Eoetvoesiella sp.]
MSPRQIDQTDIEAAITGGLILSAGGSGRARVAQNRAFAQRACAAGPLNLISIDDLDPKTEVLISTAVGAPGGGKHLADPDHAVLAAKNLIHASGAKIGAVMPGHVPGIYAWLLAAELGVPLLDAACNGRGHPTVRMGSLGLSSQPLVQLYQAGVGAALQITVRGNTLATSALLRAAAIQAGGLIMACRGPLEAGFVASAAARGAITFQLDLGKAVLAAGNDAHGRITAALQFSGGKLLAQGTVVGNNVVYQDGFDVGQVIVRDEKSGSTLELGVCNEFMTANLDGCRVSTFPDLQASIDPASGQVMAISEMQVGTRVSILTVAKSKLPMGPGIFDPAVYPDVEQRMNTRIADYALDLTAQGENP